MNEESTSVLETEPTPSPSGDQKLAQLLKKLLIGLGVLVLVFSVIYYFGEKSSSVAQTPMLEQAVINAEAKVKENPNDLTLRVSLANAYAANSQLDEAIGQLDEILRVSPDNRAALLGVGVIEYSRGNLDQAKSALQRFVRTQGDGEFKGQDTQLGIAYYTLGQISTDQGEDRDAVGYLTKALAVDDADADAWFAVGKAYLKINKPAAAVDSFTNAVAFVPVGWCDPYEAMVGAYEQNSDTDGATYATAMAAVCNGGGGSDAAPLNDLIAKGKFLVESYFTLGLAAENDGDEEAAAKWYQKLLKIDPTNIIAQQRLGSLDISKSQP